MTKIKLTNLEKHFEADTLNKSEKCNIVGAAKCCCDGSTRAWRKSKKSDERGEVGAE